MLRLLLLTSAFSFTTVLTAPAGATCQSGETVSGTTCSQECNTDRYGGDISSLQVASFTDCALACNQDQRCLTAQYSRDNGFCYLKSAINGPQTNPSVDGVVCRQPSTPPTPTAGSCPSDVTYTTASGVRFEYTCGLDYNGGDLRAVYGVATVEKCLDECGAEPLCLKATWNENSRVCYLKNGETSERRASGDWGARRLGASPTTTSSTTSSTTTSTTTTTPSTTATTTMTTTTTPSTTATTTMTTTSTTTTTTTTTTTSPLPIPSCSPGLTCSPGNYRYNIHCREIITSGANPNTPVPAPDAAGCVAVCDNDPTCVAYSYSYVTRICTTYSPLGEDYTTQPDDQGVFGLYEQGDCPL